MLVAPELSRDVTIRARRPTSRAGYTACAVRGAYSRAALYRSRVPTRQRLHPFGFRLASGNAAWYYTVYNEMTTTATRRERSSRVPRWSSGRLPMGWTVRDVVTMPRTEAHETAIPLSCLNSHIQERDIFTLLYSATGHVVLIPRLPERSRFLQTEVAYLSQLSLFNL